MFAKRAHAVRFCSAAAALGAAIAGILSPAISAAQVVAPAADNDMDLSFADDGWSVVDGRFNVVKRFTSIPSPRPGGGQLDYIEPPDGNAYTGASTVGQSVIAKEIEGLTPGTEYVVEWYMNADRADVQVSYLSSVYFEVTFCGATQQSHHITWDEQRVWAAQSLVFSANAPSCQLSFRALGEPGGGHPSGIGGNYNDYGLLDGVQVSASTSTDFAIAVAGPAVTDGPAIVFAQVTNQGPTDGTAPVVSYVLPRGVSALSGASGPVPVAGPDAGNWACVSQTSTRQVIRCSRVSVLPVGISSAFSVAVEFAAAAPGTLVSSRLSVGATPYAGNGDPNLEDNSAVLVTEPRAVVCGDLSREGNEDCDDGNTTAGDGCDERCYLEQGYRCPDAGPCVDIDECSEGFARCFADLSCRNTPGAFTCGCEPGTPGCSATPACRDASGGSCEWPNYDCVNTSDSFVCECNPQYLNCAVAVCGDGGLTAVETCDDGNQQDGDGCDHNCMTERGWTCIGGPSTCTCDGTDTSLCGSPAGGGGSGGSGGHGARICRPHFNLDPGTGRCVPKWLAGCSAHSGATRSSAIPLLALGLLGLLVSRKRRRRSANA